MDWHFRQGNKVCTFRAAAVLIMDGRVLVQRSGREYALPAVRVEFGRTADETLAREFLRETGMRIKPERLLWVEENLRSSRGSDIHNLTFYYLVSCESFLYEKFGSQTSDGSSLCFEWAELSEIDTLKLYPAFVRERINCLSDSTEHFVTRE